MNLSNRLDIAASWTRDKIKANKTFVYGA